MLSPFFISLSFGVIVPDTIFLIDDDGNFLIDDNGNFLTAN